MMIYIIKEKYFQRHQPMEYRCGVTSDLSRCYVSNIDK